MNKSPHVSRRDALLLAGAASVSATALMSGVVAPVRAFASTALSVGRYTITTLSDGFIEFPADVIGAGQDPAERAAALAGLIRDDNTVHSPLNVTLIRGDGETILIDAGSGERFVPTAGRLLDALDTVGVAPEDITRVILTHAHPDHLWGTVDGFDEVTFYEAQHHVPASELDFWRTEGVVDQLPEEQQAFAVGAQRHFEAIDGQIATMAPGDEIVPGIEIVDTSGHTPGHVSVAVSDAGESVMVLGDALAHPVISFRHPDWHPRMDLLKDKAVTTRRALLDRLATDQTRIIGYHLTPPGIGHVEASDGGYRFVPQ